MRKAKSDLTLCGVGSAVFGIWLFLKNILYLLFAGSYLSRVFAFDEGDLLQEKAAIVLWLAASFLAMLLHILIGRQAIREAKGKEGKRRFYLVLAGALLIFNAAEVAADIAAAPGAADYLDLFCDMMLEAARAINFAALLLAARKLRVLRREERMEAAGHAD